MSGNTALCLSKVSGWRHPRHYTYSVSAPRQTRKCRQVCLPYIFLPVPFVRNPLPPVKESPAQVPVNRFYPQDKALPARCCRLKFLPLYFPAIPKVPADCRPLRLPFLPALPFFQDCSMPLWSPYPPQTAIRNPYMCFLLRKNLSLFFLWGHHGTISACKKQPYPLCIPVSPLSAKYRAALPLPVCILFAKI